jgi:hypothetical protein
LWLVLYWLIIPDSASAQVYESVGSRALGMGGAFVALADDSTAPWWNPAGPAAGPFLDLAAGKASGSTWIAASIPPLGIGYYRFEAPADPTAIPAGDRQEGRIGNPLRARQFGVTFLQSLMDGVHVGLTAKYVRAESPGGGWGATGDLDAGILAVVGAFRVGAAVRNLRAPVVGGARLDRQVRIGAAFDAAAAGHAPGAVSIDVDLRAYEAPDGRRRVVALGGERWLADRRLGVRAGARLNTTGARGKAVTAGISAAVRPGMYVEAHAVGGSAGERGWGAAGRVSF